MRKNYLLRSVIYQIFVRDFTPEGTINSASLRLEYIKSLGIDIIYLMPLQPIGVEGRKGSFGSPYAIKDYRMIDAEQGTMEDLKAFVEKAHNLGMKVIMDVVFNHTARDSVLLKDHPEWYYHDKNGNITTKFPDWSDVYDLDHSKEGLDEYLVETLKIYADIGMDGFRFDVASLINPKFYRLAREILGDELIFFSETIDTPFLAYNRSRGVASYSNGEMCAAGMDIFYHYGSWECLRRYLDGERTKENLHSYMHSCTMEESGIPEDKYIVRCLENHDRKRICSYKGGRILHKALLAYTFFTKGPAYLYNGEEIAATHYPSLFEKETIDFTLKDKEWFNFVLCNIKLKQREENEELLETIFNDPIRKVLHVTNFYPEHEETGLFNLSGRRMTIKIPEIQDGSYKDLLTDKVITIKDSIVTVESALILKKL